MANYNLKGARFLRMFTADKLTPAYAANTDAENIVDRLCGVPWKRTYVEDATMTCHSTESQKRGEIEKSGLDWNVDDRENFDAATFCAEHSGGMHRAYANASCYVYALPQMQAYPELAALKVKATSDPYNASGLRIAVKTSDTLDIPTACADCRTGDFHAEGACPHTVVTDSKGNVSWFANTKDVSFELSKWNAMPTMANTGSRAVAYGNGRFVAVGTSGVSFAIEYGDESWAEIGGLGSDSCTCICYANGRFVASGTRGSIFCLDDNADEWVRFTGDFERIYSISHGNGRFVAVGNNGASYALADGATTWTTLSGAASNSAIGAIAYGGNRFVCENANGQTYALADGSTAWVSIGSSGDYAKAIAFGNGRFVKLGNSGATYKMDSSGSAWTSLSGTVSNGKSVAYGNGRFVAVAGDGHSFDLEDGSDSWTELCGEIVQGTTMMSVCYGDSRFVAVRLDGAAFEIGDDIRHVQLKKYLFVFVLKENYAETRANWLEGSGFIKNSLELTSSSAITGWTDGGTYDCSEDPASAFEYVVCKDGVLPDVDATSCGVVAVNVLASGTQPVQDATTKFVTNIAQVSDELSPANSDMGLRTAYGVLAAGKATAASAALCHVDQKRIGAGFCVRQNTDIKLRASAEASPLSPRSIALTASSLCIPFSVPAGLKPKKISFDWSSFAKTWTSMNVTGGVGVFGSAAYGNNRFVFVGRSNGTDVVAYDLVDGERTVKSTPGVGGDILNSVAYGNGRFVSVGYRMENGVSYSLADGATTWTNLPLDCGTLYGVAYGNGRFVAVGNNGASYALADGATTWTVLTGASGFILNVAYGNGRFVALANNGASYALADGATTWTQLTGPGIALSGVAYGNGRFVAVSYQGQDSISYSLADGETTWNQMGAMIGSQVLHVAYGNGRFVAVGLVYPDFSVSMSYSLTDGSTTWTNIESLSEAIYCIAYGNGRFVSAIQNLNLYKLEYFSTNGATFNFWMRSGYQDGYAEIPFANPSLYYADGNSVGGWTLLGSVSGAESSASFDLPFDLGKTSSVLVTAFIAPENVTPTTNSFSTGAGDFYYNAISADADVTSGSSVVRMFGSGSLMVPDVKLIG